MPRVGLSAFLAIVERDLRATVPDISFGYGKTALAKHSKLPRVTWVPGEGTIGPYIPSDDQDDEPHPIAADHAGVMVHCWADSDANDRDSNAERLAHRVIAAIRRRSGRWCEFGANTRDDLDSPAARGWLYIFLATVTLPIVEEESEMATITSMPFDESPPPDGVLQAPGDE